MHFELDWLNQSSFRQTSREQTGRVHFIRLNGAGATG